MITVLEQSASGRFQKPLSLRDSICSIAGSNAITLNTVLIYEGSKHICGDLNHYRNSGMTKMTFVETCIVKHEISDVNHLTTYC